MVRRAKNKDKLRQKKKEKDIILIATEGKNKTEKTYFSEFNRLQDRCHIVFADGNSTDPEGIVKDAINSMSKKGVSIKDGDIVYAVFDTDYGKEKQIRDARRIANMKGFEIILSNPCFEIWLLLHFRFSTKAYRNNDEILRDLQSYWPEYRKGIRSFEDIVKDSAVAISRAKKLEDYHKKTNNTQKTEELNPFTDVFRVVKAL